MAFKVGLMGIPNSGKSYSRIFTNGKEGFVIMPDSSDPYLLEDMDSLDKPMKYQTRVKKFAFKSDTKKSSEMLAYLAKAFNINKDSETATINEIVRLVVEPNISDPKVKERVLKFSQTLQYGVNYEGHYIVCPDVTYVKYWCQFIEKYMPHIKNIFLPDFSHYITNIIATEEFKNKGKTSGGAYGRYTDMAIDTVHTFFTTNINSLRDDIIVVIEFHIEQKEGESSTIFVPSGNMINNTFVPVSYFDVLLLAYADLKDRNIKTRYHFQTQPTEEHKFVRCSVIEEEIIPNNLSTVLEAVRENIINRDNNE
jgi:hypothetical protein